MRIVKLSDTFFEENSHLLEVMDKTDKGWELKKKRGYGIVIIHYNQLTFGIPLRSHLMHKSGFKTSENKGLDYTKAELLNKAQYITNISFIIPNNEYLKIQEKSFHIRHQFEKYIQKYIKGKMRGDINIINQYKYSTLVNYHKELGVMD